MEQQPTTTETNINVTGVHELLRPITRAITFTAVVVSIALLISAANTYMITQAYRRRKNDVDKSGVAENYSTQP